jgi:plastocyanin
MRVHIPLTIFAVMALAAACGGNTPTSRPPTATTGSGPTATTASGPTATTGSGPTATPAGGGTQGSAENVSCNDGEGGAPVSIIDFGFQPATAAADGGVVLWKNTGSTQHTVTFDNGKDCGSLAPGDLLHVKFLAPGSYPYHCSIHTSMKGTVTVTG